MNISFCGSGFLGIYHIGVVKALIRHAKRLVSELDRVGGASAGALAGAMLVCEPDKVEVCKQFNLDLADEVRDKPLGAFTPNYNLLHPVRKFIVSSLPAGSYRKADGVLHLSLTTLKEKTPWPVNKIVSSYKSDKDLIEALIASCYIPVYAGIRLPQIENKIHTDGGLTNNLIVFEEGRTITVSPFCGDQDICPLDPEGLGWHIHVKNQKFKFNKENGTRGFRAMFPPPRDILLEYFQAGFNDALRFLRKEGLIDSLPDNNLRSQ